MLFSESVSALFPALVQACGEMPDIGKANTAEIPTKTGGKYSYRYADLGGVLEAVRPVLARHGLAALQPAATTESGHVQIETLLVHTSGEWCSSTLMLRPGGGDPQSVGSAITYGRRYALLAMLGVATEDDDGAKASRPWRDPNPANDPPPDPAADEVRCIGDELVALGAAGHGDVFKAHLAAVAGADHLSLAGRVLLDNPAWRGEVRAALDSFTRGYLPPEDDRPHPPLDPAQVEGLLERAGLLHAHPGLEVEGERVVEGRRPPVTARTVKTRIEGLPAELKADLREWALTAHGVANMLHPSKDEVTILAGWLDEHGY